MLRVHMMFGMAFKVAASFKNNRGGEDAANAWMTANPGYGVLAVTREEVIIAHNGDSGIYVGPPIHALLRKAVEAHDRGLMQEGVMLNILLNDSSERYPFFQAMVADKLLDRAGESVNGKTFLGYALTDLGRAVLNAVEKGVVLDAAGKVSS